MIRFMKEILPPNDAIRHEPLGQYRKIVEILSRHCQSHTRLFVRFRRVKNNTETGIEVAE
jgi:hypothetical protein